MMFLIGITTVAFSLGIAFAIREILIKAFERKIKRVVKRCKREWMHPSRRTILRSIYVTEQNYVEEKVDEALKNSGLFEKEVV